MGFDPSCSWCFISFEIGVDFKDKGIVIEISLEQVLANVEFDILANRGH